MVAFCGDDCGVNSATALPRGLSWADPRPGHRVLQRLSTCGCIYQYCLISCRCAIGRAARLLLYCHLHARLSAFSPAAALCATRISHFLKYQSRRQPRCRLAHVFCFCIVRPLHCRFSLSRIALLATPIVPGRLKYITYFCPDFSGARECFRCHRYSFPNSLPTCARSIWTFISVLPFCPCPIPCNPVVLCRARYWWTKC